MIFLLMAWSMALAASIISLSFGNIISIPFVLLSSIMTGYFFAKYTE